MCEIIGRVFARYYRYDMKIFLGDFNAKVGREDVFKPSNANESPREIRGVESRKHYHM
jgi:hypothetical protein